MIFKNSETYDRLKWIALILTPALVALIIAFGEIWGLDYFSKIAMTISAIGVFLGKLLKDSSKKYKQQLDEIAAGEAITEDGDQGEIPLDEEEEAEDEPFEP